MANIRGSVSDDLQDYIPNVCTNSPANGLAFCQQHSEIISRLGYPTGLREFLKSCASSIMFNYVDIFGLQSNVALGLTTIGLGFISIMVVNTGVCNCCIYLALGLADKKQ